MSIDIITNPSQNVINVAFSGEITDREREYLERIGFKSKANDSNTWFADNIPSYARFVHDLKEALAKGQPFESIKIQPSFQPSIDAIAQTNFRIVEVWIKNTSNVDKKPYLVFDRYKKVCLEIARQYAQKRYGEAFERVEVTTSRAKLVAESMLRDGDVIAPKHGFKADFRYSESQESTSTPNQEPTRTEDNTSSKTPDSGRFDYLDHFVSHMHEAYSSPNLYKKGMAHLTKEIENLAQTLGIPNQGMVWEAAELSWLLWYQKLFRQPVGFTLREHEIWMFWQFAQPRYLYSDSTKEVKGQYSTPAPIAAIIAEYTQMSRANSVFDPSAGNGLLVLGAKPKHTHVNEIDPTRLASLRYQGFGQITSHDATNPFPEHMARSFDVVVTNPPFRKWEAHAVEKQAVIQELFHDHYKLRHARIEHVMTAIALNTLKDDGKAAVLIMGHLSFDESGYIDKYKPFFTWLYMHYHVEDVINLDGFKLYHKQGTVVKTMLILINGRKVTPAREIPHKSSYGHLEEIVSSYRHLKERVLTPRPKKLKAFIHQLTILLQDK